MAAGAVSLRKSHDSVILSFCNIVKGQANDDIGWNFVNIGKTSNRCKIPYIVPASFQHLQNYSHYYKRDSSEVLNLTISEQKYI